MKREYDFSKGVRGKFYRKGAELHLPIYLDAKLQAQLERLAEKKGSKRPITQGSSRPEIHDRVDRKHRS